jgi:hypothetical protein
MLQIRILGLFKPFKTLLLSHWSFDGRTEHILLNPRPVYTGFRQHVLEQPALLLNIIAMICSDSGP